MVGLIYTATSKTTGKVYVGLTTQSLTKRKRWHLLDLKRGSTTKFYNALRKYGWEDFVWAVVLTDIPIEALGRAESDVIAQHDSLRNGYNTIPGGTTSPMLVEAVVEKARLSQKGRVPWNKGIPRTPEEKQRMREAIAAAPRREGPSPLLGRTLAKEHRERISSGLMGNTHTKGKSWTGDRAKARDRMMGNKRATGLKGKPKTGAALEAVRSNVARARAAWAEMRKK